MLYLSFKIVVILYNLSSIPPLKVKEATNKIDFLFWFFNCSYESCSKKFELLSIWVILFVFISFLFLYNLLKKLINFKFFM